MDADFESAIAAHAAERADSRWAYATTSQVSSALERAVGQLEGARLLSVDCRSTTCVAEIAWDHYSRAFESAGRLLNVDVGLPCGTRYRLTERPDDQAEPYNQYLLLDCSSAR
jgi:hypothetical protein